MPTSTRQWLATFAAAVRMSAFGMRSRKPRKRSDSKGASTMTDSAEVKSISRHAGGLSRRAFLESGMALGGVLLVGFRFPTAGAASSEKTQFSPDAFIRIDGHGKVTLIMPQVEMGQGIYTSVPIILAEELDAAFDGVTLEPSLPNDKLYGNPVFGLQVTGNSDSI